MELNFETELRGFNKEEVISFIEELESENRQKLQALAEKVKEQEQTIADLRARLELRDQQKAALENDIETKYKTYIENYDKIAALVYEAQIKADTILKEAHEKESAILADADAEAERRVRAVREEVEATISDGKMRYRDIRKQIAALTQTLDTACIRFEDESNAVRSRFEKGYREVHVIFESMPEGFDETVAEEAAAPYAPAAYEEPDAAAEGDFDEDEPDEGVFNDMTPVFHENRTAEN